MSLSTEETLLLERYLILQRGSILARSSWQDCPEFFAHIPLREINIIVWLAEDGGDTTALESFFEVILCHNFAPWFSWLIVAETEILEEIQLYLSFLELGGIQENEAAEKDGDSDPIKDDVEQTFSPAQGSKVSIAYLEPEPFFHVLEAVQPRLHGICFPQAGFTLPEPWYTPLKGIPHFTFNSEESILQTLYDAHINTANVWMEAARSALQSQDFTTAIEAYHHAIALNPFSSVPWLALGKVYLLQKQLDLAKFAVLKGMGMDRPQSLNYQLLGTIYEAQQQWQSAIVSFQNSLDLDPNNIDNYCFLGYVLAHINEVEAAEQIYRQGLDRSISHSGLYLNLGNALYMLGDLNGAIDAYQKSIKLRPTYAEARVNLAMTLMLCGDYENGWREYEARFQGEDDPLDIVRPHAQPPLEQWDGNALKPGDKLLVVSEQGLGDTFQFMRYIPYLRQQGIEVSLCALPKLQGLIQVSGIDPTPYSPEDAEQITEGKWISLLSLPRHLGITPDRPLVRDPYIHVPQERVEHWRKVLAPEQRPIIGICWRGRVEKSNLLGRFFSLDHFAAIAQCKNVRLLSLQKGVGAEQMDTCPFRDRFVTCQGLIDQTWDFVETAAIMANCNLIITPDTATAHLAGGMGKTTWLLLQKVPDWRWGMETEDSFWYPSLRLFRQRERGNWTEVFQRVRQALEEFIAHGLFKSSLTTLAQITSSPMTPATILAPISVGELMDKITILEIKAERIPEGPRLDNVRKELQALEEVLKELSIKIDPGLVDDLKAVNIRIWDTEEAVREHEHRQDFGETFIQLARSVYRENDRRAAIKRDINTRYGSALVEEKSYPTLVYNTSI
jgi:tetratricopeptide (TPR) repeat protein